MVVVFIIRRRNAQPRPDRTVDSGCCLSDTLWDCLWGARVSQARDAPSSNSTRSLINIDRPSRSAGFWRQVCVRHCLIDNRHSRHVRRVASSCGWSHHLEPRIDFRYQWHEIIQATTFYSRNSDLCHRTCRDWVCYGWGRDELNERTIGGPRFGGMGGLPRRVRVSWAPA